MKISLDETELKQAVKKHLESMGIEALVNSIDFTTTRNPTAVNTTITIGESPGALTVVQTSNDVDVEAADTSDEETVEVETDDLEPEVLDGTPDLEDVEPEVSGTTSLFKQS